MLSEAGSEDGRASTVSGGARAVARALERACAELLGGRRVAIAFSGGLDSSLIAHLSKGRCGATLYVAGRAGCGDRRAAREAAGLLAMPLVDIDMTLESLPPVVERIGRAVGDPRPIEVAVMVPLAYVCAGSREEFVVTGTGADELFGGYARYRRMAAGEREREMTKDYEALKARGAAAEVALGTTFGKAVLQPFMAHAVADAVRGCGVGELLGGSQGKGLLRAAAMASGLPRELAGRPKKAAQYGSGAARLLARLAKGGAGGAA